MDLGLNKKTIFITGGSSGIGRATALAYANESGVNIAISYYHGKDAAKEIVDKIEDNGNDAIAVKMDLADFESIHEAVKAIVNKFGSIHVLVNNAVQWGNPQQRGKSFEEVPIAQWQETVGINLFGTVKVTQEVVPYMRKQQFGRIVNISSDVALDSMKGSGPYGSLKAALFGFNANLVAELSADNILSNIVIPSWTLTDRAKKYFPEDFQKEAIKAFPTKRITQPEEVASLIAYLGSAANGHINGEHIRATGHGSQAMLSSVFEIFRNKKNE